MENDSEHTMDGRTVLYCIAPLFASWIQYLNVSPVYGTTYIVLGFRASASSAIDGKVYLGQKGGGL